MQDRQTRPVCRDHRGRGVNCRRRCGAPIRRRSKSMSDRNCPIPTPRNSAPCLTAWAAHVTRLRCLPPETALQPDDNVTRSRISRPAGLDISPIPSAFGRSALFPESVWRGDQIDMTPLQSRDELVAWLEAGVKPPSEFRIGTEHEKTPFTLEGHRPVPYERRAWHRRAA